MLELVVKATAALSGEDRPPLARRRRASRAAAGGRVGDPPREARIGFPPRLQVGEGLAGGVACTRRPLVIGFRSAATAAPPTAPGCATRASSPSPACRSPGPSRLLGVLCVFTWRRHDFTRHEVDLLRSFASHAAVAVESAALRGGDEPAPPAGDAARDRARDPQQREPEASSASSCGGRPSCWRGTRRRSSSSTSPPRASGHTRLSTRRSGCGGCGRGGGRWPDRAAARGDDRQRLPALPVCDRPVP